MDEELKNGVSFFLEDDELFKEDSTVADLIKILSEFPQDMKINGYFEAIVNEEEEIIFLDDKRVGVLLEVMEDCPYCSQQVCVEYPAKRMVN